VLFAVSTSELAAARLTTIVLWMDLLSIDDDVFSHDRLLALGANLVLCVTDLDTDCLALEAERITLILFVLDAQKALSTLCTSKVVGMVDAVTETNTLTNDRLLACKATLTEQFVEALFTVVLAAFFHERLCLHDATVAVVALETLWVVAAVTDREDFSDNRLSAEGTGGTSESELVAISIGL